MTLNYDKMVSDVNPICNKIYELISESCGEFDKITVPNGCSFIDLLYKLDDKLNKLSTDVSTVNNAIANIIATMKTVSDKEFKSKYADDFNFDNSTIDDNPNTGAKGSDCGTGRSDGNHYDLTPEEMALLMAMILHEDNIDGVSELDYQTALDLASEAFNKLDYFSRRNDYNTMLDILANGHYLSRSEYERMLSKIRNGDFDQEVLDMIEKTIRACENGVRSHNFNAHFGAGNYPYAPGETPPEGFEPEQRGIYKGGNWFFNYGAHGQYENFEEYDKSSTLGNRLPHIDPGEYDI